MLQIVASRYALLRVAEASRADEPMQAAELAAIVAKLDPAKG